MRKPLVLFFLLLAIFSWIWISRARNPSNRPDSYADGLQDSAYWWSDVSAEPVSSQWQLSAGVPENYIPVPGKSGLYMVVDEEGYIIAYRQGIRREDGIWDWEDVNPDIPENYEAVPGLKDVYKVTAEDGSVRYFRYIRNRDEMIPSRLSKSMPAATSSARKSRPEPKSRKTTNRSAEISMRYAMTTELLSATKNGFRIKTLRVVLPG